MGIKEIKHNFGYYFLYTTVFITGASVLIIEILGTRIISPFYGTTVFVWTSLIIVTLGALALGYFFGGRLADKFPNGKIIYFIIFISGIFFHIPMKIDQYVLEVTNDLGLKFGPLIASFLLFFIPLFLLGMIPPFVIRLVNRNTAEVGSSAGKVFAFSTLGSIVGGFFAGFYFLDKLSVTNSLTYAGLFLIALSVIGLYLYLKKNIFLIIFTILAIGIGFLWVPPYVYSDTYTLQIHHQEQSFYADHKVIEIGRFTCLATNGSFQSCYNNIDQKPTFTYISEVERIIEERNVQDMLLLGLGTGNVLYNLPDEINVDVVEIDPKVFGIAKDFFGIERDDYHTIAFDDARHFLNTSSKKYDLVLVDIALGNVLPAHIFSKEGMALWAKHIKDKGLILINGEGKLGDKDRQVGTILKTASSVFPSVELTVTEPDRFTSVLVHLSKDPIYQFMGGGEFVSVSMDYGSEEVMTDDFNKFEIISLEKLKIFRNEMINVAGLRLLFSD